MAYFVYVRRLWNGWTNMQGSFQKMCSLSCWLPYGLFGWKEHNQHLWVDKVRTLHQPVYQTGNFMELFNSVRPKKLNGRRTPAPWTPLPAGWLEANLDGTFDQATRRGGIGVVVLDSTGTIVGGVRYRIDHMASPDLIEAAAAGREQRVNWVWNFICLLLYWRQLFEVGAINLI